MASKPKLIMLDEPAAGMNGAEKEALADIVRRIRDQGFTVLVIEHDMKFMMGLVEKIYVLNFGQLLASGSPKEIQENPEVIAAYLGGD
jgi:branched-chain amino acid transport system ATP-binding protein